MAGSSQVDDGQTDDGGEGSRLIVLGKVSAPLGLQGWSKITSYTEPPEGILEYKQWSVVKNGSPKTLDVVRSKPHGKFIAVKFEGVDDRDSAALLTHSEVVVTREQLPEADDGFYWADLIGLKVNTLAVNGQGAVPLGVVDSIMETGANDVLVVKGDKERLVPWIEDEVIIDVNLSEGTITVDWDPEF